jgi:ubiquinone/menaquinone biosynthesis C-methylase UbiE
MQDHLEKVAEAFSRKASLYDEFGRRHPNLQRMRQKVRQHALRFLQPGDRILELNAGTGGDALFFASQGFRVHAIDLAPGMVQQIQAKAQVNGLQHLLTSQVGSFTQLDQIDERPFDYVFSNMGGVNCIDDLSIVAQQVEAALKPGGFVTWVVMPPLCLWELAAILRGDRKTALRRLNSNGVLAHVEGVYFRTWYYSPRQAQRAFGVHFRPAALQGLSVFTPPADHKNFAMRFPRLYRCLCFLDDRLADRFPFTGWGDFFILSMEYAP